MRKKEETPAEEPVVEEAAATAITLTKIEGFPEYTDASLKLEKMEVAPDGKANIEFAVANYELGAQTADAETQGLANSGKGQHIHFILDNGPYSAHYGPSFEKELKKETTW